MEDITADFVGPIRDSSIVHQKKYIRLQAGKRGLVEAIFKFDVHELRVFMTMLAMIRPEDEEFELYKVRVADIIKLFNLNRGGKIYNEIRAAAHRLQSRVFVFPRKINNDDVDTYIPVLTEISTLRNVADPEYIYLQFHSKLKPYLLQLRSEYLSLELRYVINLSGYYSIRLYMMLKHRLRQNTLTPSYPVSELREKLNVSEDMYPRYSSFKQQILVRALQDINANTDLEVEIIEEVKRRRLVFAVTFRLTAKTVVVASEPTIPLEISTVGPSDIVTSKVGTSPVDASGVGTSGAVASDVDAADAGKSTAAVPSSDTLLSRVERLGFTAETLEMSRELYSDQQIRDAVEFVEAELASGKQIDNPAGLLRQTLKNPDWMSGFLKKREEARRRQQTQETARRKVRDQQQAEQDQESAAARQYQLTVELGRQAARQQVGEFTTWLANTRNPAAPKVRAFLNTGISVEVLLGTDDINLCSCLYSYYLELYDF